VVNKAFEVRSREIVDETPPLSAEQLNQAFQVVTQISLADWQTRPGAQPYEVLEVLPSASLKMVQQIYRVIALHVHPDANPGKTAWANELMKQLNAAYDAILKEKNGRRK
jgi:DnaJ-class molecular chaperone